MNTWEILSGKWTGPDLLALAQGLSVIMCNFTPSREG